ncbi:hypothetical protein [Streptomyces sp. NPDC048111]|uniref:hypothetical protein n=1 Tax=Streptomyces sp. NPDC048111 TaxID=3365500 RepID=UPI00370F7DF3
MRRGRGVVVGEDWQRDVLRELSGDGPAPAAPPHPAAPRGPAGTAAPTRAGADGDGFPFAAPAAGPEATGERAPAGPAEGTFRMHRYEPRPGGADLRAATPVADPRASTPVLDADVGAPQHAGPAAAEAVPDPQYAGAGRTGAAAAGDARPVPGARHPGTAARNPRPATLPGLRVPGGRDAVVPLATPESVPTVDPRLALALGRPVHGDSVTRRAGRSVRRLGSSASQDVAEETRIGQELQQPVTTGRVIAVTSIRGGVGKTTVAALLARSFNHYRHDPVLALEADGALGTLPVRLGAESVRWCCADLAPILTPAMQLTDVTGYLVPITDGGWLLPAGQARLGAPLSMRTYRTVTLALRRYFAVTVVDCETLPGEVARTAMDTAHARVVVAPMTAEGVGGTRVVLDWLAHLPHQALATTVVALTANSPDMTLDVKAATAHLREAGVTVFPVPYDRHLAQGGPIQTALLGQATRRAAVALAAEAMERAARAR